tara:strand:- start:1213 stop:1698 length:486 start_codon:yes stop_codon:yes gene_type:complete
MSCPKCEQRAKDERQALSQCEKQQKQAAKVNQRMAIAVAVLSTLIGKEAFDRFTQVTDVVNSLQVGKADNDDGESIYPTSVASNPKLPKPRPSTGNTGLGFSDGYGVLTAIPGSILPPFEPELSPPIFSAGFLPDPPDRFVPFAGPMLLFGLAMVRPRRRK